MGNQESAIWFEQGLSCSERFIDQNSPDRPWKHKQMLKVRKIEKDPQVRDRILLNVLVKRDGMSVTGAARHLGMTPSWGAKWHNRYLKEGIAGLQTSIRSDHPPRISGETLKAVKKK